MIENLLKFRGRFGGFVKREIGRAAQVGRIHRAERYPSRAVEADSRLREFVGRSRTEQLDGLGRIVVAQRGERTKRRHELRHGFQRSLHQMRAERLCGVSGPFRRRHIFRDSLQANGIPGEIRQAIIVADHFAERTRDKSGARRQLRA